MSQIDLMFPPRPTALARDILRPWIREGDVVIDATAGNGHDTLFLAGCVGSTGRVLAFDVQEAAIKSSKARLEAAGFSKRTEFFRESHRGMENHADAASVSVIMFNLGYLPGQDHDLTTEFQETLAAMEAASRLLLPGGILSVVCYPGHEAGATEAEGVENWLKSLASNGWRMAKYGSVGTKKPAPFLLIAQSAFI